MQPSMLLGDREERRPLEKMFQGLTKFISPILPKKYRAIHGKTVAAAMINASKKEDAGFFRYTYADIINLSTQS
jgi:hypothetical protein